MKSRDGKTHRFRGGIFPRLSRFTVEHLLVLPLGALIALVWANTAAESYSRLTFPMTFLVNDVAMVLLFGLIFDPMHRIEGDRPVAPRSTRSRAPDPYLPAWTSALPALISAYNCLSAVSDRPDPR